MPGCLQNGNVHFDECCVSFVAPNEGARVFRALNAAGKSDDHGAAVDALSPGSPSTPLSDIAQGSAAKMVGFMQVKGRYLKGGPGDERTASANSCFGFR